MSKSGTHFHFKQFSVRHDRCSMKVGTDGVLLGAWADVTGAKNILDIGTGSGVIAIMLAQLNKQKKTQRLLHGQRRFTFIIPHYNNLLLMLITT